MQPYKRFLHPGFLLLYITIALLIVAFSPFGNTVIDFHFHDTFFVISRYFIYYFLGGITFCEALIYYWTRGYRQIQVLQYFHVFSIYLFSIIVWRFADFSGMAGMQPFEPGLAIIATIILLLGQLLFFINIITGFIRGKKTATRHNNAI